MIARSVYDMTTGNVTHRWKPKQNAANTTYAAFTYDARKLFAITEVNELGHQRDYVFEYGTGTRLQTDGPNVRTCRTNCPPRIRTSRSRSSTRSGSTASAGRSSAGIPSATTAASTPSTRSRPRATSTRRPDLGHEPGATGRLADESSGRREKTELDGHGRPIKKTVLAQGSAPHDHVTTFVYRNDGTLQTVSVPDPTANDASVVSYTYGFDSLGRATSIRRPDAAERADQSGVDIAYDGVTQTTTEVVGAAGGQVAVTKTVNDKFGRLIEVHERTGVTPPTWATTHLHLRPRRQGRVRRRPAERHDAPQPRLRRSPHADHAPRPDLEVHLRQERQRDRRAGPWLADPPAHRSGLHDDDRVRRPRPRRPRRSSASATSPPPIRRCSRPAGDLHVGLRGEPHRATCASGSRSRRIVDPGDQARASQQPPGSAHARQPQVEHRGLSDPAPPGPTELLLVRRGPLHGLRRPRRRLEPDAQ